MKKTISPAHCSVLCFRKEVSLVTANEWMVIIIAAAAFVFLNIIIWTFVTSKHRRSAETAQEQPAPIDPEAGSIIYQQPEEEHKPRKSNRKAAEQPEYSEPVHHERKIREDFRLIDNIIIVHTNERL